MAMNNECVVGFTHGERFCFLVGDLIYYPDILGKYIKPEIFHKPL